MTFLAAILGWLTSGPLDQLFKTIDTSIDNETERERIKADLAKSYLSAQASVLTGRGWWFPLFFLIPTALHYGAVCIYSILWCAGCRFPQAWTIAALPSPLDQWEGAIVGSLFIGAAGERIIGRLRK
ncbi:MAG: hypothetical protein M9932_04615 [Xanthobacteraceae bacterium]|nr:hypothetical protein [Xanthobacteraceae bacterium]